MNQSPIPDPHETRLVDMNRVADRLWRAWWWLLPLAFVAGVLYVKVSQWLTWWLGTVTPL